MPRLAALALALVLALAGGLPAQAVLPDEMLADPKLEARARDLSAELRCMVCQNQSIDESDAELARDLRILLRERLQAGDSDTEVMSFLVARYGDYILLKPRLTAETIALWTAPILFVLAGGVLAFRILRRPRAAPPPLTADEARRLDELVREEPRSTA